MPRRPYAAAVALLTAAAAVALAAPATATTATARTSTAVPHVVNGTHYRSAGVVTRPPTVKANAWAVVDMDTGRVIGAHDRHAWLPQASTIKLLTAITAADRVPALPRHRVTWAEAHPQYCTCAGLVVGRRYARKALMAGMLLPSGNDAAEALAGSDPRGHRAFIAAENAKAAALGAEDTVVVTPSGLTARGAHSSAYDLLVFLRAAQADSVVEPILDLAHFDLGPRVGPKHRVYRRTDYVNQYVAANPGTQGKSGFTTPAQNTLVVNTPVDGHHIGVATLGSPSGYSTSGARALTMWADANFAKLAPIGRLPAAPGPSLAQG